MDINQLKYIIEIDKAQSISKAAQNLFMGQPNLSKSLREIENKLGVVIFERTPSGVTTTTKGKLIVQKAVEITEQMNNLENLFFNEENEKDICLSSYNSLYLIFCISDFLSNNPRFSNCDIKLRKANALEAVNDIKNGTSRYCAVRFRLSQKEKYVEFFRKNRMAAFFLREFVPQVLVSKKSPIANLSSVSRDDLENKTIICGAEDFPLEGGGNFFEIKQKLITKNKITVTDCEGGILILKGIKNSFMFSSPLPKKFLDEEGLCQIPASFLDEIYVDAWIWKFQKQHLPEENGFFTVVINNTDEEKTPKSK